MIPGNSEHLEAAQAAHDRKREEAKKKMSPQAAKRLSALELIAETLMKEDVKFVLLANIGENAEGEEGNAYWQFNKLYDNKDKDNLFDDEVASKVKEQRVFAASSFFSLFMSQEQQKKGYDFILQTAERLLHGIRFKPKE